MRRPAEDVTDTELAMLQVLWDRGRATRRQVTDALYPDGGAAHYATVQKLLERMQTKSYVTHSREDGVLVFTATVDRDELISRRLRDMAEKLCGGSMTPLMMNLVNAHPLSAKELDELQAFLAQQKQQVRKKSKHR
jgi:BlaI family penicillinase repressor